MAQINVSNLTFGYEGSYDTIFENVSFSIDTSWKLGFVGRNGKGKTTFLQLLLGKYEYQGAITRSVVFDYFPYPVKQKDLERTAAELNTVCVGSESMPVAASIVLGYAGVGEASIELILKTVEEILIAVDTHKHVGCPVPFDDDGRTVALGSTAAVRPLLSSLSELRTNSISLMVFDGPRQDTGQVRASVDAMFQSDGD